MNIFCYCSQRINLDFFSFYVFSPQIGLVESQSYAKILLISNWRSAGSFISSIIGSYPATLLHSEVLKVIVGMHKVSNTDKKAAKCIGYLKKLLTCDFTFLEKGKSKEQCNQSSTEGRIFTAETEAFLPTASARATKVALVLGVLDTLKTSHM